MGVEGRPGRVGLMRLLIGHIMEGGGGGLADVHSRETGGVL